MCALVRISQQFSPIRYDISMFVVHSSAPWPLSIPPNAPPLPDAPATIFVVRDLDRFIDCRRATASDVRLWFLTKEAAWGADLEVALQSFVPVAQAQVPRMVKKFDILQPKPEGLNRSRGAPAKIAWACLTSSAKLYAIIINWLKHVIEMIQSYAKSRIIYSGLS